MSCLAVLRYICKTKVLLRKIWDVFFSSGKSSSFNVKILLLPSGIACRRYLAFVLFTVLFCSFYILHILCWTYPVSFVCFALE